MSDKQNKISLDQFMRKIADVIVGYATAGWEKINLKYAYDDDYVGIDGSAEIGRKHSPLNFSDEAADALECIFDEIKTANPGDWNTVNYFLTSKGDCDLNFSKEDLK